jgi:hypothetical protein
VDNPYQPETEGIFTMLAEDYHDESKGLSRSMAQRIVSKSAEHMRYEQDNPTDPTKFMDFGTLTHCSSLEPETLKEQYYVRPSCYPTKEGYKPWHGGADWCEKWKAAHSDRIIISAEEETMVSGCSQKVRSHPLIGGMLKVGQVEQSYFARDPQTGLMLRCRTDLTARDDQNLLWVADIKKVQEASRWAFTKTCRKMRYAFQECFYRYVLSLLGLEVHAFVFVAVEEKPPHGLGVFRIHSEREDKVAAEETNVRLAIDTYVQCKEQGSWPGYPDAIQTIDWRGER